MFLYTLHHQELSSLPVAVISLAKDWLLYVGLVPGLQQCGTLHTIVPRPCWVRGSNTGTRAPFSPILAFLRSEGLLVLPL